MADREGTRALALEGEFLVAYETRGLADTMGESLFYMDTGERDPSRGLRVSFRNVAAFFCVWSQKPKGYYNLKSCQRRLLLEPVKSLEYWQESCGLMNESKKTCTYVLSRGISADNVVATISYLEAIWLLHILEHHLEHLSRSYYPCLKTYYTKIVPSLADGVSQNIFTHDNSFELLGPEFLERLLKAVYFYIGENWGLEEMRQEYLHFNAGRIGEVRKGEDPKFLDTPRFRTAAIKCSKQSYEFWVRNEIDIVLINQLRRIFAPLFFAKITRPELQYCYFGANNTTNKITGNFCVNYYNGSASTWEPLIEPFSILYTSSKQVGDEIIKLEIQDQVNVNVTEDFLLMLKDYWSSSQMDSKKKSEERFIMIMGNTPIAERPLRSSGYETASSYAIDNQTGETLSISILDYPNPQKVSVFPSEQVNLCTRPAEEVKSYFVSGRRMFRIKVEFPARLHTEPIYCVNLSSVGSFEHKCGRHFFHCTNKIVNTQKVLTIGTSFQLENKLGVAIVIRFHKSKDPKAKTIDAKKEYLVRENGGILSIPLSLIEAPTSISLRGAEGTGGSQFTFLKLSETLTNPKHMLQIKIEENYYVILSLQADAKSAVSKVSVWAPLCLRNCIPAPLQIQSVRQKTTIHIEEMGTKVLHSHALTYEDTLEVSIPNFKRGVLEYDLGITSYTFTMTDEDANEVKLHMEILLNSTARYLMLFYVECTIKNLTQHNLTFFSTTKVILLDIIVD